jgi:hypothetical protein
MRASAGPRFAAPSQSFPVLTTLARALRAKQYAIRTERNYVDWCHRFLAGCPGRALEELGRAEVQRLLTDLGVHRAVAASTQNQVLNALVFLLKDVLG